VSSEPSLVDTRWEQVVFRLSLSNSSVDAVSSARQRPQFKELKPNYIAASSTLISSSLAHTIRIVRSRKRSGPPTNGQKRLKSFGILLKRWSKNIDEGIYDD